MLTPLRIIWRDPKGLESADSPGACRCDDGQEYALKDGRVHKLTPHAEWFCTNLAGAIGIACPPCAVIEDEKGNMLFGSRWEGGLATDRWWEMMKNGDFEPAIAHPVLSKILAFDYFIHNGDRHLGNYLVRGTRNGWTMLAFDFSRAWTFNGFPLPSPPIHESENTVRVYRILSKKFGFSIELDAVNQVLDRLSQIGASTLTNILSSQPKQWLPESTKNDILLWWQSSKRTERIDTIRKGIGDGSFL